MRENEGRHRHVRLTLTLGVTVEVTQARRRPIGSAERRYEEICNLRFNCLRLLRLGMLEAVTNPIHRNEAMANPDFGQTCSKSFGFLVRYVSVCVAMHNNGTGEPVRHVSNGAIAVEPAGRLDRIASGDLFEPSTLLTTIQVERGSIGARFGKGRGLAPTENQAAAMDPDDAWTRRAQLGTDDIGFDRHIIVLLEPMRLAWR